MRAKYRCRRLPTATRVRNVSQIGDYSTCTVNMGVEKCAEQPGTKGNRALKMTLLVTGAYLATWIPFTVCQVYQAVASELLSTIIRVLVTWPLLLNPLLNVVIYSATKKSYRVVARKVLRGCRTCTLDRPKNDLPHGLII